MVTPVQTSGTYIGVNTPVRKSAGSNPVSVILFLIGYFWLQYVSNVRLLGDKFYNMYQMSEYAPINFIF